MTWKSYAAVSGATLLAGWVASWTPPPASPIASTPAGRSPAASAASANIVREAERLQSRVSRAPANAVPSRDPFRFSRTAPAYADSPAPESYETPIAPEPLRPAAPILSLSGIAEDVVEGQSRRTAVLSTPSDVLLVREGEEILGRYRVIKIEDEAVELLSLDDGGVLRLGLR